MSLEETKREAILRLRDLRHHHLKMADDLQRMIKTLEDADKRKADGGDN